MVRFSHSLHSKFVKACAAGLLGLGALTATVNASAQAMPAYDPQPRQSQNQGMSLTQQNLPQFFQTLNIKGDVYRSNDGGSYCTMPVTIGNFRTIVTLSLSPDLTKVWMTIPLGTLARGTVDPTVFAELLQRNDASATFFAIGSEGMLTVKRSFDNISVTKERFTLEASRLLQTAEESASVWGRVIQSNGQSTQSNQQGYPPADTRNNDPYNPGRRTVPQQPQQPQYDPNADVGTDGRIYRR